MSLILDMTIFYLVVTTMVRSLVRSKLTPALQAYFSANHNGKRSLHGYEKLTDSGLEETFDYYRNLRAFLRFYHVVGFRRMEEVTNWDYCPRCQLLDELTAIKNVKYPMSLTWDVMILVKIYGKIKNYRTSIWRLQ